MSLMPQSWPQNEEGRPILPSSYSSGKATMVTKRRGKDGDENRVERGHNEIQEPSYNHGAGGRGRAQEGFPRERRPLLEMTRRH